MDIIAYGAASKEKRRAEELATLLGADVKGGKENLQGRLDALMDSMDDVTRLADRVIVRDAVNLMKAEARLNTVVQAKKYGMEHMFFDDLLDLSGIDTVKSTGYVHDAVKGEITGISGCMINTKNLVLGDNVESVIVIVDVKKKKDSGNLIPLMTSNNGPSGRVQASSSMYLGAEYRAFDRSANDWFASQGVTSGWISYEFASKQVVNKYTLSCISSVTPERMPSEWTFEAWDGTKWLVLDTRIKKDYVTGQTYGFSFLNEAAYIKYRLNVAKNNGDPNFMGVNEMEMMYENELDSSSKKITVLSGDREEEIKSENLSRLPVNFIVNGEASLKIELNENETLMNYGLIWT